MARRFRRAITNGQSISGSRGLRLQVLCAVLFLLPAASAQQDSGSSDTGAGERDNDRIARLSDSLDNGSDWEIAMPSVGAPMSFEDAVRSGQALQSDVYRELHADLQDALRASPEESGEVLSALRERLRDRVQTNAELGYIYAAGVYIEMLELAGAPDEEIRALTRELDQRPLPDAAPSGGRSP